MRQHSRIFILVTPLYDILFIFGQNGHLADTYKNLYSIKRLF